MSWKGKESNFNITHIMTLKTGRLLKKEKKTETQTFNLSRCCAFFFI